MRSQLRAYLLFCKNFNIKPFPVSRATYMLYLAFLGKSLRSYNSLLNYAGLLKHINLYLGADTSFMSDYGCTNLKKGLRRILGDVRFRKSPITIDILSHMCQSFDPRSPLHSCFRALILVAFFSFLRKSNLLPSARADIHSSDPLHLTRKDIQIFPDSVVLRVHRTKTLQFRQRVLHIPLPLIPNSALCPVHAVQELLHASPDVPEHLPLFGFMSRGHFRPILAHHFSNFIKHSVSQLGLDPSQFSAHSFRRGGATFAFTSGISPVVIKEQGDWLSDAYLLYLTFTPQQKVKLLQSMATQLSGFKA